ncbi:MAG TPA: hypothetical protein VHY10_06120 [Xanthobacteraceae bacterium]|jgi:uncharacterized protein YdaU (DUF1376 family)|nr:hypothetical protein [Xanthobacteraceae bacterium]
MAYSATVLHVLIASPSDVESEREIIARSLHDWNALNSQDTGKVLLPVMWESHSAPSMSGRPQGVINDQLVRACDMLIGAFWTRLGSPTGVEESGTIEEIKWFLKNKKPVMLYFSKAPIPQDKLDVDQIARLNKFKAEIKDRGLQDFYDSPDDLMRKLPRHITRIAREITVGTVVDAKAVRRAAESEDQPSKQDKPKHESKDTEKIFLEDYSEKAFLVRGNTLSVADDMRSLNGKWLKNREKGVQGWMFSKRHLEKVAKALNLPAVLKSNS